MIRVFFDTNLFIYLIEGVGERKRRAVAMVEGANRRGYEIITSSLTLGEVLVHPLGLGDKQRAADYERLFAPPAVTLIDLDPGAARRFAAIRSDRTIKAPDAIQLACAAAAGTDLFITNDERLTKKIVARDSFHYFFRARRALTACTLLLSSRSTLQ